MVKFTTNSKLGIRGVMMRLDDLRALIPICKTGLPEKIPEDMKEAIEALVCLAINPLRGNGLID